MDVNYLALPGITAVCGVIVQVAKYATGEKYNKWLPLISCVLGAVLGVLVGLQSGTDALSSVLTGIVSGAAATGIHQTGKQLVGGDE